MNIISAQEVLDRNKDLIEAVTDVVKSWLDTVIKKIGMESPDLELAIMPTPYMLDENEIPVQYHVFYDDETGMIPKQLQLAGIWLAGVLDSNAMGDDEVSIFETNDPRFTRSVLDALTAMMLEVKHALKDGIPPDARELVREQLETQAIGIVSSLLGEEPPEEWGIVPAKVLN